MSGQEEATKATKAKRLTTLAVDVIDLSTTRIANRQLQMRLVIQRPA